MPKEGCESEWNFPGKEGESVMGRIFKLYDTVLIRYISRVGHKYCVFTYT